MNREARAKLRGYAILGVALLITASVPGFVALFWGFAWGLLAAMAVGVAICWLAGKLGMAGGFEVLFFGSVAAVVGLIVGTVWRLLA